MRLLLTLLCLGAGGLAAATHPLEHRIKTNNPDDYRRLGSVHAGAGEMDFTGVVSSRDTASSFLYLHAGVIQPGGGIGHHFHHKIEEMYVILDGEAEFTINGRTSVIQAPAIVPCKMGDSHAIYNPTDQPIRWLNWAVSSQRPPRGDAFDLGDDRVGAAKDDIPVFVSARLEADRLQDADHPYVGDGARHRRVFRPSVFTTDWHHVDHVVIPPGGSTPKRQLTGVEEIYYVINGAGTVTIGDESAPFAADNAIIGKVGESVAFTNPGSSPVEMLVIGVAAMPRAAPAPGPLKEPKAMVLQMDFVVAPERAAEFERMYYSIYVPAMRVQTGYLSSKLLRLYSEEEAAEIQAEPTTYNYQIQISFDTEENRRRWVASDEHQIAWPAATAIAEEFKWRGYDVMGDDNTALD